MPHPAGSAGLASLSLRSAPLRSVLLRCALGAGLAWLGAAHASAAAELRGRISDATGAPIVGAMVSLRQGDPVHELTVFSDELGGFRAGFESKAPEALRVRRIGWRDLGLDAAALAEAGASGELTLVLEPESDPAALAAQLPANRWYALLLAKVGDSAQREELVRQCTYCHQQGNWATRRERSEEEWQKLLSLMARMGGVLSPELRGRVPELFSEAYDPASAVPALTAAAHEPGFAPPPPPRVRAAAIEEWAVGERASMQHDLAVHPDGRIYSVDMTQDRLYRFDPESGARDVFPLPHGELPLGGVFGGAAGPLPPNANAYVGPHSLQVAPDGSIWSTLALGNQLARFDTVSEQWQIHPLEEGIYPHTLRFDQRGRIWYTMAVSNHVGLLDPATGRQTSIRLPARSWGQALALRAIPLLLWLGRYVDLGASASGEGGAAITLPIPYGIDIAPDGAAWFSQLNEHRIGRIDPDSLEVRMLETPFSAPRRLRFDSRGRLWIPGFSSGLIARFEPTSGEFVSYPLPIEPIGSETPYALNVHRETDTVWICGTNSDSLIRFDPVREEFTVYPLPTRVTYTREIDFDAEGRVWTSNSNLPAWQIEGGLPRLLRLDPSYQPSPGREQARGRW